MIHNVARIMCLDRPVERLDQTGAAVAEGDEQNLIAVELDPISNTVPASGGRAKSSATFPHPRQRHSSRTSRPTTSPTFPGERTYPSANSTASRRGPDSADVSSPAATSSPPGPSQRSCRQYSFKPGGTPGPPRPRPPV